MKVIIDGCDLTGKTTLLNNLIDYFKSDDLSTLHLSYRDRRDYIFYDTLLDKTNFISDRHFLDEPIYSKVFNRKCLLTSNEYKKLIKKCKKDNIKIIILTVSDNELIRRSELKNNEEPEVLKSLLTINNTFLKLAKKYNFKVFDTTRDTLNTIIDYIMEE